MKELYRTLFFLLLAISLSCEQVSKEKNTLSPQLKNVQILKDSFAVINKENLPIYRKVWLYLPPDYNKTKSTYPVVYMHDGQNLFEDKTSFAGEWKVDETLNELNQESGFGCIVVGIENVGPERMNEYSPWTHQKYGGGSGDRYLKMIINNLKPKIDANYRTKTDRKNTAIIGSSMGGLISYYAGLKHPDVFGKIGALSTSFWFSDDVKSFTLQNGNLTDSRLYLLVGGKEGGTMDKDMFTMKELLLETGFKKDHITSKLNPNAEHNEAFWSGEFKEVITWLFEIQ